ncbi:MAG: glycosyltransferase [Pseudomonadota bacterium]
MAKKSSTPRQRKPRLLWANPFCLMDTSSGASMTVRQMLLQLVAQGYEVQVLGATVFDDSKGMGRLQAQYPDLSAYQHQLIEAEDGPLTHQLVVSLSHNRNHFTTHEEGLWYSQYLYLLESFKPDVVWFYGGQTLDMLIPDEARDRGIPVAFYLANGNYKSTRWCRDVDLVLTDSQATAEMYRKEAGFAARPVGKFIDPGHFVAEQHERKRLLFVNPSWQKGASVFVQLAEKLERERPEIELEVVEARADWPAVLRQTTQRMGKRLTELSNVVVTPNTSDMRGPYRRARILVSPSLWWESSGRVLAEAMLNGIPALITNRGGMPEMIDDAGIAFDLPEACYEAPYQQLLSEEELQPLYDAVVAFYDDEALYQEYVQRAWRVGEAKHHIDLATERLLAELSPLVRQRAGNKDFSITQRKRHRQRLASRATKPDFKVDTSLQHLLRGPQEGAASASPNGLWLTDEFTWQLTSKVIVLDNRAKLIKLGLADPMAATQAFGIVAFDPASEVKNVERYEGSEHIQVFQHALLGDGQSTTLNACVAPELTGTLKPLPAEQLPERRRLGAQPIAELPINTVALDSIDGLDSLDWLILDELSDAMAVLEHGKQWLGDTLLIQARVALQPTHERQPSLAEYQHWASRNGFRFYRFHDAHHHSHLPEKLAGQEKCATDQESADVLFLPSHERMATLSDEQKTKLAFVLSTVFRAHDMAFDLVARVDQERAIALLEAQGLLPLMDKKKESRAVPPPAGPAIKQENHAKGDPKVSIVCAAYNHTKFIEDAIISFVSQKTNFPFEIIIHDDASTDGTQDIIKEYACKYPDMIRPIYQDENQYSKNRKPLDICLPLTKGKYVAICEGDDYWTDSGKLQAQFDYMESHDECSVTHHNAFVFDDVGLVKESKLPRDLMRGFTNDELMRNDCFLLTLSVMFRKYFDKFPKEKGNVGNGDNFLISILGLYGKSHYIENIKPAAYRLHPDSTWSSKTVEEKRKMLKNSLKWIGFFHERKGRKHLADYYYSKASSSLI